MKYLRLPATCSARLPTELVTPGSVVQTLSSSGKSASSRLKPSSSRTRLREKSAAVRLTGLDERAGPHLGDGLTQFLFRVHHDRPVPGDRLFDRFAGDQQEADALIACLDGHFVAAIEEEQRSVRDVIVARGRRAAVDAVGLHRARLGR